MKNSQKMGGIAALIEAAAYLLGLVLMFSVLAPGFTGDDTLQKLAFLADNLLITNLWIIFIFVVAGGFLVVLALALYDRLKAGSPGMVQTATAFGLIWAGLVIAAGMVFNIGLGVVVDLFATAPAQATTVWLAIHSVFDGLGGGVEIVGGLWILLLSWAALRAGGLPKALNYLGVVIGVAGIISVIPALSEMGGLVFGLGQIVWFAWVGIVMLRSAPSEAA